MPADTSHPFFKPLWRRVALVLFCGGWSAFEFYMEQGVWGWVTLAIFAYAVWAFLIVYKAPEDGPAPSDDTRS